MTTDLELQVNKACADETIRQQLGDRLVLVTPPIDEGYWMFRVALSEEQAIVGFPKFFTIGIGFQHEEDWNTNLPYTTSAERIYEHIKHNKGDDRISTERCIEAIRMVQAAAARWSIAQGTHRHKH